MMQEKLSDGDLPSTTKSNGTVAIMTQQRGFTLIELMIVVTIIALIAAFGYPSYLQYVQRSARAAAEAELMADTSKMERLRAQTFSYSGATAGTGANDTIYLYSPDGSTAANAKYTISFVVGGTSGTTNVDASGTVNTGGTYEIMAVSTGKFDSSGKTEALKINQAGQRCYAGLASGVTGCTISSTSTDLQSWP
jgi:type IV pilus assembly protein PilE